MRFNPCFTSVSVAVTFAALAHAAEPKTADEFMARGLEHLKNGRTDQAIADFSEVIRLTPKNADAFVYRGMSYRRVDTWKSIPDFTEAIRLDPNNAKALTERGRASLFKGGDLKATVANKKNALADFTEAIRVDPKYADAYYQRAEIQRLNYEAALADYTEALRLDPKLYGGAHVLHNRGVLHFNNAKYALAISDFQEVIRIDPRYAANGTEEMAENAIKKLRESGKKPEVLSVTMDTEMKQLVAKKSPAYKLPANSDKLVEDTIRVKHEVTVTEGWKAEAEVRGAVKAWFVEVQAGVRAGIEKSTSQTYGVETERKRSVTIRGNGSSQGIRVVWVDLYRTGKAKVRLDGVTFEMPFAFREDFDLITEDATEDGKK